MISGHKLLIADDSITIQKVVELTFLDEGMEVASVGDGDQAIDKLEEFVPDVVLADVFMPGRNGYEVCAAIKHSDRFHNIPVMLLVGSFEPFDEAEARRVGADDVLTKPFQSIRQLVNRVGTLLGGTPAEAEATTRKLSTLGLESSLQVDPKSDTPEARDQSVTRHQADSTDLMSTAEIEITTADTQPLTEPELESTAFAGDNLMPNPASEPVVDMAEPFGAEVRDADDDQTAWADRLSSDTADQQLETPLRIEHMDDYQMEQSRAAAGVDQFDDVLLDLGDLDAPPGKAAYADSILELEDEAIAPALPEDSQQPAFAAEIATEPEAASVQDSYERKFESGWSDSSTLTSAEKYAALEREQESGTRERAEVAAWEIVPSLVTVDEKLDEPPALEESAIVSLSEEAIEPASKSETVASESGGAERLSAALIDAIARRVVEQMSDKVVREIAWEVVPELAERMIKRRVEEEK